MSEVDPQAGSGPAVASSTGPTEGKREQAARVLGEILSRMDLPAELDVQDGPDGAISVALRLPGEPAGAPPGRRSHVTDALQFLANKIVNRPGTERRWISLGIGGHPAPRSRVERVKRPPAPTTAGLPPSAPPRAKNGQPVGLDPPATETDDLTVEVPEDPELSASVQELAEKSSRLGRHYAIAALSREDRSRIVRACSGVKGLRVGVEGEGRSRRVVFTPDHPTPLPRQSGPIYDDDEPMD